LAPFFQGCKEVCLDLRPPSKNRDIYKSHEMRRSGIIWVELFNVWGINFIVKVPHSHNNVYILVVIHYVSKCVEAIATPTNDSKMVIKFPKKNILTRLVILRALLSGNRTHFCKKPLETLLKKYGGFHKVATPYHSRQVG